jgi:hypothetical protein
MVILDENNQPKVVAIPADALVTVADGDPEGNGFVKVRYRDKTLSIFAVDLRTHGERMLGQPA